MTLGRTQCGPSSSAPTGRPDGCCPLPQRALDAGHSAVAVNRRPDDFPIADPNLTVAGTDVHDAAALVDIVAGRDVVLFTLGVPFTREPVDSYSVGTYPCPCRTGAPFALRLFEPVITRTIGKTVYDDMRRMEEIVRDSGLDWTLVRPSGLFDLPYVTEYVAGEVDPVGAFTSRATWRTISSPLPAVPVTTTP